MRELWETKHGSPGFTELVYSRFDWDTDNSNSCKIIQITWCICLEMLLLFGGTFSSSSSYKDMIDSCQFPIVVSSSYPGWRSIWTSSTGPEGGTQKHADNERMTHCRHWQKAHSSGPSLQSGFAVSAHRATDGREKWKTEEETKGIITMFKTFPHHLTSMVKDEANLTWVKCLFESQGFW